MKVLLTINFGVGFMFSMAKLFFNVDVDLDIFILGYLSILAAIELRRE